MNYLSTQNLESTSALSSIIKQYNTEEEAAEQLLSELKTDGIVVDEPTKKLITDICYYVIRKTDREGMYIIYNNNTKAFKINNYWPSTRTTAARPSDVIIDNNGIIPKLIKLNMLQPYRPMFDMFANSTPLGAIAGRSGGKKNKSKKNKKSKMNKSKKNKSRSNRK